MIKKRLVLTFPADTVEEPVTYNLITRYHVMVNILRASIDFGKQGRAVVEISGTRSQVAEAMNYLESLKVSVSPLSREIRHLEERCTGCTACLPHCPTDALCVDRNSWEVSFDPEKCIVCLSCIDACVYHAMTMTEVFES